MNRTFINTLFLILVLVTSQLVLFACAGTQEVSESERKVHETKYGADASSNEPWTGTWKVSGLWGASIWKLKQSGSEVKSIQGSERKLGGGVKGNRLKGWLLVVYKLDIDFKISDDFTSFEGMAINPDFPESQTYHIKGVRQE